MPGLKAFLQKTMIFTAASPADLYSAKLGPSDAIVPTKPVPTPKGKVEDNAIFNWTHDPSTPAKITNLNANVRAMNNMNMTVCDSIEVERVAISLGAGSPTVLPLDIDHVVAKFKLDKGHIPGSMDGWWRLEANTDWSMAVVFAYEIVRSMTMPEPAPKVLKVSLGDLEKDSAFPIPPFGQGDPDYMDPNTTNQAAVAGQAAGESKTLEHAVTAVPPRHFVVVVFGFTTCKERADFEPGGILGAGRVYPHVMVLSSQGLANAETTVHLKRPAQGMTHDNMDGQIGPLLATDADTTHGLLPTWSNVFNYVVTDPIGTIGLTGQGDVDATGSNWMTVVDPAKTRRPITGKIKRETVTHIPDLVETADFWKLSLQGEFDNLHLAPGMNYDPLDGPKQTGIKMAPFCVHDCFHTHFRWGNFLKIKGALPKSNKGFNGRIPYGHAGIEGDDPGDGSRLAPGDGRPLVPSDQTVKIGLTSSSSVRYFAKTTSVHAGAWTVFNHHGSAYALGIASPAQWVLAGAGVQAHALALLEPYGGNSLFPINSGAYDASLSTPAFYFRLRWTGHPGGAWVERLQILDFSPTTGVRS